MESVPDSSVTQIIKQGKPVSKEIKRSLKHQTQLESAHIKTFTAVKSNATSVHKHNSKINATRNIQIKQSIKRSACSLNENSEKPNRNKEDNIQKSNSNIIRTYKTKRLKAKPSESDLLNKKFGTIGDLMKQATPRVFFPSGCMQIDMLLKHGIESGRLSIIIGEPNTGKTTIAYAIFFRALLNKHAALLVDRGCKLEISRAWNWAKHIGIQKDQFDKALVEKKNNIKELQVCLKSILHSTKQGNAYDIIVVDGISSSVPMEETKKRNSRKITPLILVISILKDIISASNGRTCILVTNQIVNPWSRVGGKTLVARMGGYLVNHSLNATYVVEREVNDRGEIACRNIKRINTTHATSGASRPFKISTNGLVKWLPNEVEHNENGQKKSNMTDIKQVLPAINKVGSDETE